jgi:hypothetical protein
MQRRATRLAIDPASALRLNMGTLYPRLMRLEQRGLGHHGQQSEGTLLLDHHRRTGTTRNEAMAGVREWLLRVWGRY